MAIVSWNRFGPIFEYSLLVVLFLSGFLSSTPSLWFRSFAIAFFSISTPILIAAGIVTYFSETAQERIQGVRRKPAYILLGVFHTCRAAFVASSFAAWPITMVARGEPIALIWSLDSFSISRIVFEALIGVLVIDAWLYLKHRLLHSRWLFVFHREHHAYLDPTPFASFAVGPVESVLTFSPIMLNCFPSIPQYAPMYFGLIIGFICLNLYLHCGVRIELIESILPMFFINTSAFHNVHHSHAKVNFGEALYLWDAILSTRLADKPNLRALTKPAD